jgi:hypothetical protein
MLIDTPPRMKCFHAYFAKPQIILVFVCCACLDANLADAVTEAQRQSWVAQASAGLDARAIAALDHIVGADRRLLAVRAYLRAGASLDERWSWSQHQISAYASTAEGTAATADIDAVIATFAAANPGCTLRVNRMPRSLEVQLARWNDNPSVGVVAAALLRSLEQQFGSTATAPDTAALRDALKNWAPVAAAPLAAPGLSAHGQARAFDFQVERHGQVIAAIESASAHRQWDAAGWTDRLHAAVIDAGGHFIGPLASPYEPWHYAYAPAAAR